MERGCTSRREGVLFTPRGGTLHAERRYYSRREGVLFTPRGGTLHTERRYYSRREGVLFTPRGGTIHIERGYSSRREEVLFTSRGGTLHTERRYSSRREEVLFTPRGGTIHVERGSTLHVKRGGALHVERGALRVKRGRGNSDFACMCNIANVGVVKGVAFVEVSSWAIRTLRRVATDLRSYQDGRRIPLDVVDAFTISLELVYQELINSWRTNNFECITRM